MAGTGVDDPYELSSPEGDMEPFETLPVRTPRGFYVDVRRQQSSDVEAGERNAPWSRTIESRP